jgi:hypothetical protein
MPHAAVLTSYFGWSSPTGPYSDLAQHAYDPARNPLNEWERTRLMWLGIEQYDLFKDVTVIVAPRHDLTWKDVSRFYPAKRLICLTDKDEFEKAKATIWIERGETVHVLTGFSDASTLTTTRIREMVGAGADWRRFMPEASHRFFADIDGPQRVFGVRQPRH